MLAVIRSPTSLALTTTRLAPKLSPPNPLPTLSVHFQSYLKLSLPQSLQTLFNYIFCHLCGPVYCEVLECNILMGDKDRQRDAAGGSRRDEDDDVRGGPTAKEGKCQGCDRKPKKLRIGKKKRRQKPPSSGCWASRAFGGGCCLCLKQPQTLDSSGESLTSDPNSPEFTFDMLRNMIQKNDFYSKQCNPHLDTDGE